MTLCLHKWVWNHVTSPIHILGNRTYLLSSEWKDYRFTWIIHITVGIIHSLWTRFPETSNFFLFFFLPPSLTLLLLLLLFFPFLLRSLSLPHPIVFILSLWDDEWSYMEIITKMSPHLCNWGTAPISWASSWLSGKESTCQCRSHRRHGFDPWVGKNPWRRNGNSLQCSCWDNSMDKSRAHPFNVLKFHNNQRHAHMPLGHCLPKEVIASQFPHK